MTKILSNKSNIDLDYPICRPSLDLDFTQERLDPRITFTRGSIGTRVNRNRQIETVAANQPRFDYDPISGECKGLLIEESRYNDWIYSGQNVTTGWSFTPTTLSFDNTQTAPDGSTNVIKFTERPVTTSGMGFNQTLSVTSGTSYTFSIFVKQPTGSPTRYCSILLFNTGFGEFKYASFNPTNGSVLSTSGTLTTSVQQYSNGWWRFAVTGTATATTTTQFAVRFTNNVLSSTGNNGGPYGNYTGDGSSYLYFFGPQVENGAFMTSFMPTSASRVTRSSDLASMTGTNFSSWYNQTEGTVSTSYQQNSNTSGINFGVFSLTASTSNNNNLIDYFVGNGSSPVFRIAYNGIVQQVYEFGGTSSANIKNKGAFSFTTNKFFKCINGTFYSTSLASPITSGIKIPTVNTLVLGPYWAGVQPLNGTISRLTYYPRALKPNHLQTLTS
jgi:hypothetical protein